MAITTLAPFRDAATLYGTTSTQPQTTYAPFRDVGGLFAPTISHSTTGLQVLVNGTPISNTFARSFEEQIADTGSFQFQMLRDDFAGIDFDDLIQFRVDGTARFLGVVENLAHTVLAQGEAAEQTVTVSGRRADAEFDQAVVYPSRGVGVTPIETTRSFSWPGPDFDFSAWPAAKLVNAQREYASWRSPLPWVWPDTGGYWIWANLSTVNANYAPAGVCLFRKNITLADDATVRVFCAGDNHVRLWIDGAEVSAFSSFTVGRYVEIELTAGTHYLAAKVNNDIKSTLPNPGGFIAAVYTVGDSGLLDELVTHTDTTWKCLAYPTTAPGFTHGQVIRTLVEEAGLDSSWTLDFTDTVDTAGQSWSNYREITVDVGRTLLEVLREMSDAAIDYTVAPGSRTLRAWNRGGRGTTRSVTLQQTTDPATSDFLSLSHSGKRTRLNKALIRFADGHTEQEDTTSTGIYGDRGGYIELGTVDGEVMAKKIADELMDNRAAPAYSTTATLHPRSTASTPFVAFDVGDFITCPDETDANVSMRVLTATYAEDENGKVDYPITLRDEQLEAEERYNIWLRRMADGAALGGARVSSRAGTPAPIEVQVTGLKVAEFSFDNSALAVSSSPVRPAEVSGNIVEVVGQLTTAGSSTTTVEVIRHGGSVLATLTFASGETQTEVAVSPPEPVLANTSTFQASITAAGTGAAGLDVQIRAV